MIRLRTTDYGRGGNWNYGTTESRNHGNWLRFATPDNGQRRAKPAHCSRLKAHSLSIPLYTFYTLLIAKPLKAQSS